MFGEDIFKDAKYCVPCNKFYVTNACPFCTPKKESRIESQESRIRNQESTPLLSPPSQGGDRGGVELRTQDSRLDSNVEELSLEIERLRRENKERKVQIAKEKELELKFNILADKFEHLSQKEKEHRERAFQEPFIRHDSESEGDTQTKLLKERINELNAELERLQQRNEGKDRQLLQSTAEASKLSGIVEQQTDELERLRFDVQDKDRVIMQISLTLSSAISQALTQREVGAGFKPAPTKELTTPHPFDARPTTKQDKHSRKGFYALLGGLNAVLISYIGCVLLYERDIVNLIIEFFRRLFEK